MACCAKGQLEALDGIVRRWERRLFAYAYRRLNSRDDAEDIVQSIWHVLIAKAAAFACKRRFEPWILSICHNLAENVRRRRGIRLAHSLPKEVLESADRASQRTPLDELLSQE